MERAAWTSSMMWTWSFSLCHRTLGTPIYGWFIAKLCLKPMGWRLPIFESRIPQGAGTPRRTERCSATAVDGLCFRRDFEWWPRRHLGSPGLWWWQWWCGRSAAKCTADSGHERCICGDSGRWFGSCLGLVKVIWRILAYFPNPPLGNLQGILFIWAPGSKSKVAWGHAMYGGDSTEVQELLRNVQQIQSNAHAFAAILGDGTVVTWGDPDHGGNSSKVQDQLRNVQQIQSTSSAFVAVLQDGTPVVWGHPSWGGRCASAHQWRVQKVQSTKDGSAFAAVADGRVVTWGMLDDLALEEAKDFGVAVLELQSTSYAFAALLADHRVVTWGLANRGGDSTAVADQLRNVQQIQATHFAFCALLADGQVVTWGHPNYGGDSSRVQDELQEVQQIQSTEGAFAAILADGSVVAWGSPDFGGDASAVQPQLRNIRHLAASERAFAAISSDGAVVAWGAAEYGGDCTDVDLRSWLWTWWDMVSWMGGHGSTGCLSDCTPIIPLQ